MLGLSGSSHTNLEDELEDSATDEDLKHEIVESLEEQGAEASPLGSFSLMGSKGNGSRLTGVVGDTHFHGGFKTFQELGWATKAVSNVVEILDVLPLLIDIDNFLELFGQNLKVCSTLGSE